MKTHYCLDLLYDIKEIFAQILVDSHPYSDYSTANHAVDYNTANKNFIKNYWYIKAFLKINDGIFSKYGRALSKSLYLPDDYDSPQITDD